MMIESQQNESEQQPLRVAQRGIYLLPNLLTTIALFAGFYAIVAAMKGRFDTAAIAILVAMIADGLDGRVARLTHTQSLFGAQYDSLSDLVAFGVAPALVLYSWSFLSLGKLGWLAAFFYTAATALRLARFNTQVTDKRYFQGLPCPPAAGLIASIVWIGDIYAFKGTTIAIPLAILTLIVASFMVSTIRYSSFKSIDFKGKVPFFTVVITVATIVAISLEPPEMLFGIFFVYLISGPIHTLWQVRKRRKQRMLEHARVVKNKN
jgi:CDP-diacylglycerol--serine O-phosphatidyltransferase